MVEHPLDTQGGDDPQQGSAEKDTVQDASSSRVSLSRRRTPFLNLLLFAISCYLGTLAVEALLRMFVVTWRVPRTENEFHRMIASNWPEPVEIEKKPGVFRILGLSDSFGEVGGHKNYHYLLTNRLREAGLEVEVVNLSRSAYQLNDEWLILKEFGARYQPDLVLHGVFVGNDLLNVEGESVEISPGFNLRTSPFPQLLHPSNHLASRLAWAFSIFSKNERLLEGETDGQGSGDEASKSKRLFVGLARYSLTNLCSMEVDSWDRWTPAFDYLGRMSDFSRSMGARFVVMAHPDRVQVDRRLYQAAIKRFPGNESNLDIRLPQKYLARYCDIMGIDFLDLMPVFESWRNPEGCFLARDCHYSDLGNELAAREIEAFLRRNDLLPEKHR